MRLLHLACSESLARGAAPALAAPTRLLLTYAADADHHEPSCLVTDSAVRNAVCAQVVPPERLHEVMQCDYVVNALPGSPGTRHYIDAAALAATKPSGVISNVGRGATIDEAALCTGAAMLLLASVTSGSACTALGGHKRGHVLTAQPCL